MRLQFFAEEGSIDNVNQLDSFLNGLETGEAPEEVEGEETPPVETPPAPAPTIPDTSVPPTAAEPSTEEPPAEQTPPQPNTKANHAFAQMRTQLSAYENLLGKVAQATGIEYADMDDLSEKLNDDTLSRLAKQQNIPVELMQKLNQLEQDSNNWKMAQLKESAYIGFQNLMNEFELTQEELNNFAVELDEARMNPFEQPVDIKSEYISRHYNDVLQRQVQKEVQAALKQSQVADEHSSTPNTKAGITSAPAEGKVTTVSGLNQFLDGLGK